MALPGDGLMVAFRGPGVVEEVAERAVLDRRFVTGERAAADQGVHDPGHRADDSGADCTS